MSIKHPVIAVTGSSGAGTTTVMKSFAHIFRREGIKAQMVEGDSFHRYNRKQMRERVLAADNGSESHDQPFRPGGEPAGRARRDCSRNTARAAAGACAATCTTPPSPGNSMPEAGTFTDWQPMMARQRSAVL